MTTWTDILLDRYDRECGALTAAIKAENAIGEARAILRCEQVRKAIAEAMGVPYRPALDWARAA